MPGGTPDRGAAPIADGVVFVTHCEVRWYTTKVEATAVAGHSLQRRVVGGIAFDTFLTHATSASSSMGAIRSQRRVVGGIAFDVFLTHATAAASMVRRGRMMGQGNPQRRPFHQLSLEACVPTERPLRAIRPGRCSMTRGACRGFAVQHGVAAVCRGEPTRTRGTPPRSVRTDGAGSTSLVSGEAARLDDQAAVESGSAAAHAACASVRGVGYRLSRRSRTLIEKLFGKARTGTACDDSGGPATAESNRRPS